MSLCGQNFRSRFYLILCGFIWINSNTIESISTENKAAVPLFANRAQERSLRTVFKHASLNGAAQQHAQQHHQQDQQYPQNAESQVVCDHALYGQYIFYRLNVN